MAKFFDDDYLLFLKLSDIDRGIHKHTIQKKVVSVFGKNIERKGKHPTLMYPGLHCAHKKLNFARKKKSFLGMFV